MYPYFGNVAIPIPVVANCRLDTPTIDWQNKLVTIYGLPSTGKGSVASLLAPILGLPYFEIGLIYRAAAYFFRSQGLQVDQASLQKWKQALSLQANQNRIELFLDGRLLTNRELKNPGMDAIVGEYSKNPAVRQVADQDFIVDFVLRQPFVTDGRGPKDGYIVAVEKEGVKPIRVLLQANQKVRIKRRFIDYIKASEDLDAVTVENLWKTCESTMKKRDEEEIRKDQELGIGLISEDTGFLDTSHLSIDQVLCSVFSWVVAQAQQK